MDQQYYRQVRYLTLRSIYLQKETFVLVTQNDSSTSHSSSQSYVRHRTQPSELKPGLYFPCGAKQSQARPAIRDSRLFLTRAALQRSMPQGMSAVTSTTARVHRERYTRLRFHPRQHHDKSHRDHLLLFTGV